MIIGQKIYESQNSGGTTDSSDEILKSASKHNTNNTEDVEFTEV